MKPSVGTKIWSALGGLLLMFLIVAGVSYQNITRLTANAVLQNRSYALLGQLTTLLSTLQDAETGQRGYILVGEPRYLEPYNNAVAALPQVFDRTRELSAGSPAQTKRLEDLQVVVKSKLDELAETVALRQSTGFDAAVKLVATDRGKKAMDDCRAIIRTMQDAEQQSLHERDEAVAASSRAAIIVILGGAVFVAIMVSVAGLFLGRSISRPLREITAVTEKINAGDLMVSLEESVRSDEVGILTRTFRTMIASLRRLIQEIRDSTNVLSAATSQIVTLTAQVSAGAAETATAVAQTTVTMEEVKKTSQVSTEKAMHVSQIAQETAEVSRSGRLAVQQSIEGVGRVREQIGSIAEAVMRLSEQSQAISEIVATVNDLAEQSNLLAVNAAIEAARAGDQGKGFVIVAQEVRSLAEQSKQATSQVRAILGDIQKATATAVLAAEQGSKAVDAGVQQAQEAGQAIERLALNIATATQAATQIVASNQQQQVGIDQVALAMENIKQASLQNIGATKQAESAAQSLNELGYKLKGLAGQYRA